MAPPRIDSRAPPEPGGSADPGAASEGCCRRMHLLDRLGLGSGLGLGRCSSNPNPSEDAPVEYLAVAAVARARRVVGKPSDAHGLRTGRVRVRVRVRIRVRVRVRVTLTG